MSLLDRRVPMMETRVTLRVGSRDVPLRVVIIVGGSVLLVMFIGSLLRLPRLLWLGLAVVAVIFIIVALRWKPWGLHPEEWLRRRFLSLWVPRAMAWRPRGLEAPAPEIRGRAVTPLFGREEEEL